VDPEIEIVAITSHDDEPLLDEFHSGIYWDDFADQQEPVEIWKRALWGGASSYQLTIRVAGRALRDRARRELLGGIAFEHYPRSRCGLVTYMVIAPAARRQGLGKRLQREGRTRAVRCGARGRCSARSTIRGWPAPGSTSRSRACAAPRAEPGMGRARAGRALRATGAGTRADARSRPVLDRARRRAAAAHGDVGRDSFETLSTSSTP